MSQPRKVVRAAVCRLVLAACGVVTAAAPVCAADSVSVSRESGFARLLFTFSPIADVAAAATGGVLTLRFDRKVTIDAATLSAGLSEYSASVRTDPDGLTFRFALTQPVRVHTSTSTNHVAIDLLPQSYSGTPPDLPLPPPPARVIIDPAKLPVLPVRSGSYQNFTRLVFDWPRKVTYSVYPGAAKLGVRFDAQARPDFTAITRFAPPWVKNASWRLDGPSTVIEFETDAASGFHDSRDGNRIIIDILAPKTDADAYRTSGIATAAVSGAQAASLAATAQSLAGANAPTVATQVPAAPNAQASAANGQRTRNGAILTFDGAANRGSAVFIRGTTAWIVLQGAPPLDPAKLKNALGTFPVELDASSADGVSVLRITLAQFEEIGAQADGSNLKVVIAPQVIESPIAIGFARNQDDASHASLSTLLPGATRAVTVIDPVAGDELLLIPAAVGRAMIAPHAYAEFAVLKTASGLVLASNVDDLAVTIDRTRVTITRPGGLALTPPTMPTAASPAALAARRGSPSFLDFPHWAKFQGGSFLATERRMRAAAARSKPEDASRARLALARFYLANRFFAEALGLVNMMQALDPALQSDRQLETMRAAANFMMGRYRDAHNDIAGVALDDDRHAALWRGLIEAALENWDAAQVDLDRAEPVLQHYPPEWQARQRIAKAETALGLGHLEVADAAVARLPLNLPHSVQLAADLVHARLLAAESRGREAGALFDTVQHSGDRRIEAESIYYRTEAALKARVMNDTAAINALERLRFRWRGDILELKTLRKLAALYFANQRWRDGLHVLRIAAESFPNDDMARKAQDDMREAFAALFLKGRAGKITPVEALAIFYDFIDLTPIGPEGDEMIRRMSERLVAVDLLAPAADLLNYQITKRLDGVARAQVATRLAVIYLTDQKPMQALDAIRSTQIASLPDDVNHQRLLLEARAFAALKQWDNALDLIAVDPAADTARLRADIYWESGKWAIAAQQAESLLATRWNDSTPLAAIEREDVMRAAVAYSLVNDETSLDRLRERYGAKMKASPDANAFAVVTQPIDGHGAAFRNLAAQIAAIDTLQAFMQDFRKRHAVVPASSAN